MDDRENQLNSSPNAAGDRQGEDYRLEILEKFGLLDNTSVPVFEEATQTVAHYLQVPVCILGILDRDVEWLKAAFGLSRLGLMNTLAAQRSIPRQHSPSDRVVATRKKLAVPDLTADPELSQSFLYQEYGICAYLAIPLIISDGNCIGAISVMDLEPHTFTLQEISYLEMTARWSVSEFERSHLLQIPSRQTGLIGTNTVTASPAQVAGLVSSSNPMLKIKNQLLNQLTQELRTPLTSVLGMAKMLNKETYGPLTAKQKEYMTIIYSSGQNLLSLIQEILELAVLDDIGSLLKVKPVDIEMLCQQATNSLEQLAEQQQQQIRLSIEPGNRIWHVDKVLVQQTIYHLVSSLLQASAEESTIRLHASRKDNDLSIAIWMSHPWLGQGIPDVEQMLEWLQQPLLFSQDNNVSSRSSVSANGAAVGESDGVENRDKSEQYSPPSVLSTLNLKTKMQFLRLNLSRHLAQIHGGVLSLQGTESSSYRYIIRLTEQN
ncbi:GAF domain-containing sensor histidine kinase [Roseofilum casamattae]|uniref:histidine kinase n=1 Tax=Roseofilum casamattae BLCC-M143 TaxID=3022442 RepID=A0ABT7C010_9CYAN|nr:histidine kinase dimerization/phospho-acceptor domain-containing protein [Roseofilum casamattae]MDJ1184069.1 histidine kinase dimerization/phospho-acceptor domain-containing protein [Roseofilum casamattae BLCC-M143]